MNFIDNALKTAECGEEFVQAMADIYSYPDLENILDQYPEWIRNIITIIDYDTNLSCEGLDFKSYQKEIDALNAVGLSREAELLASINIQSSEEEVEKCYSQLALNNDYEEFWDKVYEYADKNLQIRN